MNWYQKFALLAVGVFSVSATLILVSFAYIVYTQWQDVWSGGFEDFRSISGAIVELEKTARPVSEIAPKILVQMKTMNQIMGDMHQDMVKMDHTVGNMNQTMGKMQQTIHGIDIAVKGINQSVYGMSYTVPNRMDTIRNKMNPWRMMSPFN